MPDHVAGTFGALHDAGILESGDSGQFGHALGAGNIAERLGDESRIAPAGSWMQMLQRRGRRQTQPTQA
jgi:hypothetical protein